MKTEYNVFADGRCVGTVPSQSLALHLADDAQVQALKEGRGVPSVSFEARTTDHPARPDFLQVDKFDSREALAAFVAPAA